MGNKTNPTVERLQNQQPSKQAVKEAFIVVQSLVQGMGADNALIAYNPDFPDDTRDRFAIFLAGAAFALSANDDMSVLEAWREVRGYLTWYGNKPEPPKRPKQAALLTTSATTADSNEGATTEPEQPTAAKSQQALVESLTTDTDPIADPMPAAESLALNADAVEVTKSGKETANLLEPTASLTPPTAKPKRKYSIRQSLTIEGLEAAMTALGPEVVKQARQVAKNPQYRAELTEQEIADVQSYWTLTAQLRRRRKATVQSDQAVAVAATVATIPEQIEVAQPQMQESEVEAAPTDTFFRG